MTKRQKVYVPHRINVALDAVLDEVSRLITVLETTTMSEYRRYATIERVDNTLANTIDILSRTHKRLAELISSSVLPTLAETIEILETARREIKRLSPFTATGDTLLSESAESKA